VTETIFGPKRSKINEEERKLHTHEVRAWYHATQSREGGGEMGELRAF
jgi:hypothetical protein